MLRMPRAVTDGVSTCAGSAAPKRIGPICRPSAAVFSRLKAMLAASSDGRPPGWRVLQARARKERCGCPDRARHRRASRRRPRARAPAGAGTSPPRHLARRGMVGAAEGRMRDQRHLGLMPKRSTSSAASRVVLTRGSTPGSASPRCRRGTASASAGRACAGGHVLHPFPRADHVAHVIAMGAEDADGAARSSRRRRPADDKRGDHGRAGAHHLRGGPAGDPPALHQPVKGAPIAS